MIDPKYQWAIQIDVTNRCIRDCSNCTRLVGHVQTFDMSTADFSRACEALRDFPTESPPFQEVLGSGMRPIKVVGVLGGEPLLHPQFPDLASAFATEGPPRRQNRGLWTGMRWEKTRYASLIEEVFGYVNNNVHSPPSLHSPVLVAIEDAIEDEEEMCRLIDGCWLQQLWSSTITPWGFYFCEVAAAICLAMGGPPGLTVDSDCWRRPLADSREIIDWACPKCGIPLNLKGRPDDDEIDDVSEGNLRRLRGSPRIEAGQYRVHDSGDDKTDQPWRYKT